MSSTRFLTSFVLLSFSFWTHGSYEMFATRKFAKFGEIRRNFAEFLTWNFLPTLSPPSLFPSLLTPPSLHRVSLLLILIPFISHIRLFHPPPPLLTLLHIWRAFTVYDGSFCQWVLMWLDPFLMGCNDSLIDDSSCALSYRRCTSSGDLDYSGFPLGKMLLHFLLTFISLSLSVSFINPMIYT